MHYCIVLKERLRILSPGDCDVFTNTKIDVFDLYTKGKTRITLHRHCEEIQISGWKFNVNSSWVASTSTTFRVSYERNRGKSPRTAFLFVSTNMIGIFIRCVMRSYIPTGQ